MSRRPALECIVSADGNVGLISWRGKDATAEFCRASAAKVLARLRGWDASIAYTTDEDEEYGLTTHATITLTLECVEEAMLAEETLEDALAREEV